MPPVREGNTYKLARRLNSKDGGVEIGKGEAYAFFWFGQDSEGKVEADASDDEKARRAAWKGERQGPGIQAEKFSRGEEPTGCAAESVEAGLCEVSGSASGRSEVERADGMSRR